MPAGAGAAAKNRKDNAMDNKERTDAYYGKPEEKDTVPASGGGHPESVPVPADTGQKDGSFDSGRDAGDPVSEGAEACAASVTGSESDTAGAEGTVQEACPEDGGTSGSERKCSRCGAVLLEGQNFCPGCGNKVTEDKDSSAEGGWNKVILAAAALIITIIIVALLIRSGQPADILLNRENLKIKTGKTETLTYTISPEKAKDRGVTWTSSNEAVAAVNGGTVTGRAEGECVITVRTRNGKTDTCTVEVGPAGPDFAALYEEYCKPSFANVAGDGSYLYIDTNPNNIDDHIDYEAYLAIVAVNKALGLPESVNNRMEQTRALDGMQKASGDGFEMTWTYHPDHGMEVTYSLAD